MTKKFKTLPKIQTLQLIRNANRILLNNYIIKTRYEDLNEDLTELHDNYEASELALLQYLNK